MRDKPADSIAIWGCGAISSHALNAKPFHRTSSHGLSTQQTDQSARAIFLKLMHRNDNTGHCQVIMATHSPIPMAYPNATLLRLTKYGLEPDKLKDTDHFRLLREFCEDPKGFVDMAIAE